MTVRRAVRYAIGYGVGMTINGRVFTPSDVDTAEGALDIIAEWCEGQAAIRSDDIERAMFETVARECRAET